VCVCVCVIAEVCGCYNSAVIMFLVSVVVMIYVKRECISRGSPAEA